MSDTALQYIDLRLRFAYSMILNTVYNQRESMLSGTYFLPRDIKSLWVMQDAVVLTATRLQLSPVNWSRHSLMTESTEIVVQYEHIANMIFQCIFWLQSSHILHITKLASKEIISIAHAYFVFAPHMPQKIKRYENHFLDIELFITQWISCGCSNAIDSVSFNWNTDHYSKKITNSCC